MFSLRVTIVMIMATLTFTFVNSYNFKETVTVLNSDILDTQPVISNARQYQSLVIGNHVHGKQRLLLKSIKHPKVSGILSVTVTFGQFEQGAKISFIRITNDKDKRAGKVYLLAGGEGEDFVTLQFISAPNEGIDYSVSIFGK